MRHYSLVYFLMLSSVGVYAPWLPPFLEYRGLTPKAIGLALAVVSVWRALLPPVWGMLADRLGKSVGILALTSALSGLALVGLAFDGPAWTLIARMAVYGFFLVPVLPLLETITLQRLGQNRVHYGPVRLWGSWGFIATSLGLGWVVGRTGYDIVPYAAGIPLLFTAVAAWYLPAPPRAERTESRARIRDLPWRLLLPVLGATTLGQASHGPYYVFFTLQLAGRNIDPRIIGGLWTIGVIAEIGIMAISPRLLPRLGLAAAMRWALILTVCRWLVLATTDSLPIIGITQVLHAASYGLLHLSTIQLLDEIMPPEQKALGQTLLAAAAYGIGVGGSFALAGALIGPLGYSGLYTAAAAVGLLGWGVSLWVRLTPQRIKVFVPE
ncbi:MAG: hypothetical protein A2289_23325 [Deltaproteobacteria bacterium RIFOXYA12_FULL_58_15]|nr:MAG: hypothetical protein A2289_23325 [Deltaproteobacteria bacterium RIFOXYA12_FULL_58_15]OGR14288.1 MAG: hypothetical protein A2341_18755 [Deltaproteobacteria bacterium RIFOXYB12_FULL_58_9]